MKDIEHSIVTTQRKLTNSVARSLFPQDSPHRNTTMKTQCNDPFYFPLEYNTASSQHFENLIRLLFTFCFPRTQHTATQRWKLNATIQRVFLSKTHNTASSQHGKNSALLLFTPCFSRTQHTTTQRRQCNYLYFRIGHTTSQHSEKLILLSSTLCFPTTHWNNRKLNTATQRYFRRSHEAHHRGSTHRKLNANNKQLGATQWTAFP